MAHDEHDLFDRRRTRSDGLPGDFIGALPVNSFIQPAGLPIATPLDQVLRRPVESAPSSRLFMAMSSIHQPRRLNLEPSFELSCNRGCQSPCKASLLRLSLIWIQGQSL